MNTAAALVTVLKGGDSRPPNLLSPADSINGGAPWGVLAGASITGPNTATFAATGDYVSASVTKAITAGEVYTVSALVQGTAGQVVTCRCARAGAGTFESGATNFTLTGNPQVIFHTYTFVNNQTGLRLDIGFGGGGANASPLTITRSRINIGTETL